MNSDFEDAVIKIKRCSERKLTLSEKNSVKRYLKDNADTDENSTSAARFLNVRIRSSIGRRLDHSKYVSMYEVNYSSTI